jgi:hypothetical protein
MASAGAKRTLRLRERGGGYSPQRRRGHKGKRMMEKGWAMWRGDGMFGSDGIAVFMRSEGDIHHRGAEGTKVRG